jgi:hypothetical protein
MQVVMQRAEWQARQAAHHARIDAALAGHRERAGRQQPHAVEDFLFSYYSFRPARLRRWHPGAGVVLLDAGERDGWRDYARSPDGRGVLVDLTAFARTRGSALRFIVDLLAKTAARPAGFSCFGLHEWAMVYQQNAQEVRHGAHPLRLGPAGTDAVVREQRLRCTHHDAFRFFTTAAGPLNLLQPTRDDQADLEQPGCLHATMDLYKWAYKLEPALPSELVADCFELARRTRELDMRASPYDLRELGYQPVQIETADGRAEYVALQREIATAGQALRARLLTACQHLAAQCSPATPAAEPSAALR